MRHGRVASTGTRQAVPAGVVALWCAAVLVASCTDDSLVVGTVATTSADSGADNGVLREPGDTGAGQDSGHPGDSDTTADTATHSDALDGSAAPELCVPSGSGDPCNGADDDCDGQTDGTACQDNNPCTADSCAGSVGCVFLASPATCSDGNACTVGDSCAGIAHANRLPPDTSPICSAKPPISRPSIAHATP